MVKIFRSVSILASITLTRVFVDNDLSSSEILNRNRLSMMTLPKILAVMTPIPRILLNTSVNWLKKMINTINKIEIEP